MAATQPQISAAVLGAADEAALKSLRESAKVIDVTQLHKGDELSKVAFQKLLLAVNAHGTGAVLALIVMPNWTEGETPRDLPTGFHMVVNADKARVIPEVLNAAKMYGGTMAFEIPSEALVGSKLSETGLNSCAPSQLVADVEKAVTIDSATNMPDAYTGIFKTEARGEDGVVHKYWAVSRGVDTTLNAEFAAAVDASADANETLAQLLTKTEAIRDTAFKAQRTARAQHIVSALKAAGITSIDVDAVLHTSLDGERNYVHSVSNMISQKAGSSSVTITSDVISTTGKYVEANGVVFNGGARVGPVIMRQKANAKATIDHLPATAGIAFPLWTALNGSQRNVFQFDSRSQISPANPWTWANASSENPLLAKNSFRRRTAEWSRMETAAGFDERLATPLTPIAVKLVYPVRDEE